MERVTELISQRARETESEGGSEGGSERSGGGNEKGSKSFGQIRNGLFPTNRDTYIYKNLDAENSGLGSFGLGYCSLAPMRLQFFFYTERTHERTYADCEAFRFKKSVTWDSSQNFRLTDCNREKLL